MNEISLALGAGGARGIAHVMLLEVIDELNLTTTNCAGTSIGSVIGALYASGYSGRAIRDHFLLVAGRKSKILSKLLSSNAVNIAGFRRKHRQNWALINSEQLLQEFLPDDLSLKFEELEIPLSVIATNLHTDTPVIFNEGSLLPALASSIAIPGLMQPFQYAGRTMIDGGIVDPVPVRYIPTESSPLVAVDLSSEPLGERLQHQKSASFGTAMEAVHIMGRQIAALRFEQRPPALILKPNKGQYRSLDFHKLKEILKEFEPF